jgi:hypothetical protein
MTSNLAVTSLFMEERMGSQIFWYLWSYELGDLTRSQTTAQKASSNGRTADREHNIPPAVAEFEGMWGRKRKV